MKTIVEEASSIFKAIEKGWIKAGKPESFSVKIYEQPQKNFIGMTTRSAKVGIFFNNEPVHVSHKPERSEKKDIRFNDRPTKHERQERKPEKQEKNAVQTKTAHHQQKNVPVTQKPVVEKQEKTQLEFWTQEMIDLCNNWLNSTLAIMNLSQQFTLEPTGHQLRVLFTKPLFESSETERQMLRSFSILLLQALRHKFARPLRGFKIILIPSHDTTAQ